MREGTGGLPLPGEPGYAGLVGDALASGPKPDSPRECHLAEADFWRHRHMPPGSVIETMAYEADGVGTKGLAALLVQAVESHDTGMWLSVSVVGAETDDLKKELQQYFRNGRRQVHLCYTDSSGGCPLITDPAWHVMDFKWFPPGDYDSPFLSSYGKKKVKDGPRMALEFQKNSGRPTGKGRGEGAVSASKTERRLEALRSASKRVTFNEEPVDITSSPLAAGNQDGRRVGILRPPAGPSVRRPASPALMDKVKSETETIDLTRGKASASRSPSRKRRAVGDALAKAALTQQKAAERKERARSSKKKKKKRSRKSRKSSDEDSSATQSSSESSSLLPPLKRRSQKDPGSVLRMLEEQAYEFLSRDGVVDALEEGAEPSQRPKLVTYYQLALRPGLDPKGRDSKELALLCRSLDLLREGKLDALADTLAARLIAVETATRQGWPVARHLEISTNEEEGTAPAHILLAAQRHGKQVEKAGGKGSYYRAGSWAQDWYSESRPKGKGKDQKGKGKKGKPKGKGNKAWGQWGHAAENADGKKAPEAAA